MALTKITGRGIGSVILSSDTDSGDDANIGFTAAEGLILTGQGSTNDVTIKNDADANVIQVPTGTTNVTVAGNLSVGGDFDVTGNMDLSDANLTNAGSIRLDSISGDADSDTSVTFSGSDVITFATGGTAAATLNASQLFTANAGVASTTGNFSGVVTANAGVVVDEMTIDGDTITATDTFTIDAAADIIIDAGGGDIVFKDDGAEFGSVGNSSGSMFIEGLPSADKAGLTFFGASIEPRDAGSSSNGAVDLGATGARFKDIHLSGAVNAASLDISGDIDIDGTTNLDAVDIDGAVQIDNTVTVGENDTGYDVKFFGDAASAYMLWDASADDLILGGAGGLVVAGTATFNGALNGTLATAAQTNITSLGALTSLTVDDITINGSTISDAGDFTIDVGADINLDSGDGDIQFKDTGTTFMNLYESSNNAMFYNPIGDGDIRFQGKDNTTVITALTLDMSNGGRADFNNDISLNDGRVLRLGTGDDTSIYNDGSHFNIVNTTTNHDIMFKGNDDGANITALTLDMSAAGAATFNSSITAERLYSDAGIVHTGDTDTSIDFLDNAMLIYAGAYRAVDISASGIVFNEASADADFRVESNDNTHMIFVDAGANEVGIGTNDPRSPLHVQTAHSSTDVTAADTNSTLTIGNTTAGNGIYNSIKFAANQQNMYMMSFNHATQASRRLGFFVGSGGGDAVADERLSIMGDGAVIIKPDTITTGLQLQGRSSDNNFYIQWKSNDGSSTYGSIGTAAASGNSLQYNTDIHDFNSENSATNFLELTSSGAVFNEGSADMDFRVESNGSANALFVDGGNNHVNIMTSTDLGAVLNVSGNAYIQHADNSDTLTLECTDGDANSGPNLRLYRNSSSPADDDFLGTIDFEGRNDNSQDFVATKFFSYATDVTDGSEDAAFQLQMMRAGSIHLAMEIGPTEFCINQGSVDMDFRVESNGNANMLFVDGGNDQVSIGGAVSETNDTLQVTSAGSSGSTNTRFVNTNADASGVRLDFYKNTSSPADGDGVVQLNFLGKDSSGNAENYANINAYMEDVTAGTEDGSMVFSTIVAGVNRNRMDLLPLETVFNEAGVGGINFRIESVSNENMFLIDSGDNTIAIGTANTAVATQNSETGIGLSHVGRIFTTATDHHDFNVIDDGEIIRFRSATTAEGNISVSGSTVSYNGFSGTHESSGIATNIAIGTVVSTIDELDVYAADGSPKAGQTRADHAKVKVSDSVGDKRVYGVVTNFNEYDKAIIAAVGIGSVKVTGACVGGDLLESNGDGTAKVQSDDIIRSKTIGKVTIGNSNTGVKLVSCVLYCG